MRNRAVAIAAIPSLTVLLLLGPTGCYRNSVPSWCWGVRAHRDGKEQALQGRPIDYSGALACSAEHRTHFTTSLAEGYREGLQQYCDPQRVAAAAREVGAAGGPPGFQPQQYAICSNVATLQAAHDQGHTEGVDQRCLPATQEQLGNAHGADGQPAHFDAAPFPMCGEARVQAMAEAYARGHQRGVAQFCAPEQWEEAGVTLGGEGKRPVHYRNLLGVCSAEQQEIIVAHFERGHQAGVARYCAPERWEAAGMQVGDEGRSPIDVRGALGVCPAEQHESIVSHYGRGYQTGLARYCAPESWEPTGHEHGVHGRRAPDVSGAIGLCSPAERSGIAFHVRRGYETGLRTYCDGSGIIEAAREAARDGSAPVLPQAYAVCLDVFPDLQLVVASAYRTELTWMEQRWGSTPPMLPARFRELREQVQTQQYQLQGLSVVMDAARNNHFTAQQVKELMFVFGSESDRIEVAVALYPVVVDRANWEQIYQALSAFGVTELRERIAAIP